MCVAVRPLIVFVAYFNLVVNRENEYQQNCTPKKSHAQKNKKKKNAASREKLVSRQISTVRAEIRGLERIRTAKCKKTDAFAKTFIRNYVFFFSLSLRV